MVLGVLCPYNSDLEASMNGNPALRTSIFDRLGMRDDVSHMTINGTINKAIVLLGILVVAAAFTWQIAVQSPSDAMPFMLGGLFAGLVLALIIAFVPTTAPWLSWLYAAAEGLLLGGLSQIFDQKYPGIAMQAVIGTACVTLVMLGLYRFRIIRVTQQLRSIIIGATIGIAVLYLVNIVLAFGVGYRMPFIWEGGWIGIGFSLFVVTLAAFNLLLDFDFIEKGEAGKAPKFLEWYGAFGLMVTLVWLYIEILRLLSKLRR